MLVATMAMTVFSDVFADTEEESRDGNLARMLAPGLISTELPEFATAFSPDGGTVYFNRTSADRQTIQILSSELRNGRWAEAKPLSFSDGTFMDVDPYISQDGKRLYFSSKRPLEGNEPKDFDIWYVEKSVDGWGDPINLGSPVNSPRDEIYSTTATNGNLWFSVFDDEGDGVGIYRSVFENGAFQMPERVSIGSGKIRLTNPAIAPDESFLLLVSGRNGQADLFVSWRTTDGSYADAVALGPAVNSNFTEFAPYISADGAMLYFTSERPGIVAESAVEGRPPGDIYSIPITADLLQSVQ